MYNDILGQGTYTFTMNSESVGQSVARWLGMRGGVGRGEGTAGGREGGGGTEGVPGRDVQMLCDKT